MRSLFTTSLVTLAALSAPASGQLTSYGFDGIGAPGAFHQIPPGFANGPHLEYAGVTLDGGVILIDALFGNTATSGDNILATCDTCGLGDNPPTGLPGDITGVFDEPASFIQLDVINGVASNAGFTLTGYDAGGVELGATSVNTGPAGGSSPVAHIELEVEGMLSFVLSTNLSTGYTFAMDTLKFGDKPGTWTNLGGTLVGSNGPPRLTGMGPLTGGSDNQVNLGRALPGASCWFVLGFSPLNAPFKGGVLVPTPDLVLGGFVVEPTATLNVPFAWPVGVPSGAVLISQAWIADPVGIKGFAASNGLEAKAP
ncbi:MAG: hypothetical protein DRQ55_07185 [Planctomycetota bacterium]|nr:MAG: hypothetical protein DRQ55_07185 [Planctomycetota bacterium]